MSVRLREKRAAGVEIRVGRCKRLDCGAAAKSLLTWLSASHVTIYRTAPLGVGDRVETDYRMPIVS
jgi:DNA-binding IclR family transcriptional regulator